MPSPAGGPSSSSIRSESVKPRLAMLAPLMCLLLVISCDHHAAPRLERVATQREGLLVFTGFDLMRHAPHVVHAIVGKARAPHFDEPSRFEQAPVTHHIEGTAAD